MPSLKTFFRQTPIITTAEIKNNAVSELASGDSERGVIKTLSPDYLWNPPYGKPRYDDVVLERKLCKNAYIYSIIATLSDEVSTAEYDICVKKQYMKDGVPTGDYEGKRQEIMNFFDNPNGNDESFNTLLKKVTTDILEIESGVFVKVFTPAGKMVQLMAGDGATFLKNPDLHGYYGNRDDFIPFTTIQYDQKEHRYVQVPTFKEEKDLSAYNVSERAAYFQYGQYVGFPVPFGKREIVYISRNVRTDATYARPPVQILGDVLYTLVYGSGYNNAFYTNNNLPDGILEMVGSLPEQVKSFKEQYENNFVVKDAYGNKIKKFFKMHITNSPTKYTPFLQSPQVMQVLEQQAWFVKLVWACFQIPGDEMGFTDSTNGKNVGDGQAKVHKRKAIEPLLRLLEYHINTQIMTEFGTPELEFKFKTFDLEEELLKQQLYQLQLANNLTTINEIRMLEGKAPLDGGDETTAQRTERQQNEQALLNKKDDFSPNTKSHVPEENILTDSLTDYYKGIEESMQQELERLDNDLLGKLR